MPVPEPSQVTVPQKRLLRALAPSKAPWAKCLLLWDTEVWCQVSTDWAGREEERLARRVIFNDMVRVLKEYGATFQGSTKSWRLQQAVDVRGVIQGMQELGFIFVLEQLNAFLGADNNELDAPLPEGVGQTQEPLLSQQLALVPVPEPSQAAAPAWEEQVQRHEERVDRPAKRESQDGVCLSWSCWLCEDTKPECAICRLARRSSTGSHEVWMRLRTLSSSPAGIWPPASHAAKARKSRASSLAKEASLRSPAPYAARKLSAGPSGLASHLHFRSSMACLPSTEDIPDKNSV